MSQSLPFFAFIGNDKLLIRDKLESTINSWLGEDASDPMCKDVYFGSDISQEKIESAFQTVSMFASKKALVLRDFENVDINTQKKLLPIFEIPNESTAVFVAAEKWDARSALRKFFKEKGLVQEFKLPYSNKIPAWIVQRAREKYQRKLSMNDAYMLWEYIGDNTQEIDLELEKLDNYIPKNEPISSDKIHELTLSHRDAHIFEIQKNFGLGLKGPALTGITRMLEQGEAPIMICIQLFNHFLRLLKIRERLDRGVMLQKIPEELRINDFIFKKEKFMEQAKNRSISRLKRSLAYLSQMEADLKQGVYNQEYEIELQFARLL